MSRCWAALWPPSILSPSHLPLGSACFQAEGGLARQGSLQETPPALGKTTQKGEVPVQNSGPQGSFLPQGPYLLLMLLEGVLRGRQRLDSILVTPRCHGGGQGLGRGWRAGTSDSEHDSLPRPAFCKVLCRATSGLGTLLLCLGAQEPPPSWSLAWAEHPPRPYFCCWRQLLALLWGVSRARGEAEPSLGAPLGLLQGTCGPHRGAGPGPLLTAPSSAALFLQLSVR